VIIDIKEIEELLYNNVSDFEIAKLLRKKIKNYFNTLDERFANSKGRDFLFRHTKAIDTLLQTIYKIAFRSSFGNYPPMKDSLPITLLALGSYGREQLCVYSDIDLMIVYKDIKGYNTQEIIEKILHILWDCGLKLGHRVHEVGELFEVSKTDITIKTSMIESRFIAGSKYLLAEIGNELSKIRHYKQEEFINAKIEEIKKLHSKYPISMEPNLKDGEGGFRSANLVYWIGNILYNINKIKELPKEIIPQDEYASFHKALNFLFSVRSALHLASKRKEDSLRLELLADVSKYLGYNSYKEQIQFAKRVSHQLKVIKLYTNIWINALTDKDFLDSNYSVLTPPKENATFIELLKLLATQKEEFQAHPKFLKAIIHAPKPPRATPEIYQIISEIFFSPNSASIIQTLLDAHIISYTISPLRKVLNLPQFDGYHQYPVGIHSIKALYELEHIKDKYLLNIFQTLTDREKALLKLVVLLHDSGKGRNRDHSIVGAELFAVYAKKLNFTPQEIKIGKKLILYHTQMSSVAQKEDLNSEQTILKFASIFSTKKMLDLIYLVTYADIQGVGKRIYTSFNANLLYTLYTNALNVLSFDKKIGEISKRVRKERTLKNSLEFKQLPKTLQRKILSIPSDLLFIKYPLAKIIDIAKKSYKLKNDIITIDNNNFLSIEIIRQDNLDISYLLNKLRRLEIVNMDICKLFDKIKYFNIEFNETVDESDILLIEDIIHKALNNTHNLNLPKPDIKPNEVEINCNHSQEHAMMRISCKNQKGILCYTINIFDKLSIDITSAKIHTKVNKVNDLFLIEKNGNFCNNTKLIIKELTE
jgi:[protein-PII] uridylyltransferase